MSKPSITFIVFSYNQREYVRDAIDSAFAQNHDSLEIILSDDCSPDGTYEVMKEMAESYSGPHAVNLLKLAAHNLGLVGHLNRVFAAAKGDWIVLCAGDDAAEPNRCCEIAKLVLANPATKGAFSGYTDCDRDLDPTQDVIPQQRASIGAWKVCRSGGYVFPGATFALHRDCIDKFSPLPKTVRAEDWILPLRAALLGGIGFINQPHVRKRNLDDSLTRVNKAYDHLQPSRILNSPELVTNLETIRHARKSGYVGACKALSLSVLLRLYARVQFCNLAGKHASMVALAAGTVSSLLLLRVRDFRRLLIATIQRPFAPETK